MRIYLDYAGTSPMKKETAQEMWEVLYHFAGNPSSLHHEGQEAARFVQKARETIAREINGDFKSLYFTGSGSESVSQAIQSAAKNGAMKGKKHLITSAIEHSCVLKTMEHLEEEGFTCTRIPVDEAGVIKVHQLEEAITDRTCLVSIMYVNHEIGSIQPIRQIHEICKRKGILFHCDGTQAVPHLRVSMLLDGFDYFSFSAHKFGGPKGIGCLYAQKDAPLFPLIFGGRQERGMRAGTENVAGIVGTAVALENRMKNIEGFQKKTRELYREFYSRIISIPGVRVLSPPNAIDGIINVSFKGITGIQMVLLLDQKGIAVSSGAACEAGAIEISNVLLELGIEKECAKNAVRFSIGEDNTMEEIDDTVKIIRKIMEGFKNE